MALPRGGVQHRSDHLSGHATAPPSFVRSQVPIPLCRIRPHGYLYAAELYDQMANHVLRDEEHCVVTISPYAFFLKEGETWTAERRAKQARRLREAFPLERRAVHEITMALRSVEEGK